MHRLRLPLLALALTLLPVAADAQWAAGFRLGGFEMTNSSDSYDAIYGDVMPMIGGQVERDTARFRYALSVDYGTVDGERVILTGGGGTLGTGIDQELTLTPIHLTASWRFNPQARWEWSAGLGPSLLLWDGDGDSGSEVGGSAALALRRQGAAWDFGGELRWSTFPGTFDDLGGVVEFYDEDDAGGIAFTLTALRGF